ncbi:hypothetical protein GTQ34_08030 [Muricauda sp. JGD-17]|uniref:Uncharacterized protein n=1 Tax=Flagellimonas ochracea TaxID=2696472 RepID=A0A964TBL8_9FLAO|nr:hypothetical protein [Allomuricauda ochracea]NAY91862.1 hypothetical protein [Allomuricauda ochracea]
MTANERNYVNNCIQEIVARYFPEKASSEVNLSQRDLQYLIDLMDEKSNIRISLSTMKRLWKNDFNKMPHPSTLDALVSLLHYENWNDFRQDQHKDSLVSGPSSVRPKPFSKKVLVVATLSIVILTFLLISLVTQEKQLVIPENVSFSVNKTVAFNVPNSVIFSYDLTEVKADSFFIQRSWNPTHKFPIDPNKKNFSQIYYYPGFHWARLIANDSIIKRKRILVQTDGWFATLKSERLQEIPIYPNQENIISGGKLKVGDRDLQESGVDPKQNLILSFFNIREFNGLQSDSFVLETKVRFEDSRSLICPYMEMVLIDEKDVSAVGIVEKGCESNLMLKIGDEFLMGAENDFSALGVNMKEWQTLKIIGKNQFLEIHLNDVLVLQTPLKGTSGKIMGLIFTFTGKGVVDYVYLKDLNGKILYSDEFDEN